MVGNAGLLDGRRFTSHWYYRDDVIERHPTATWVPHQRYVIDRDVSTTTGITASIPTMLALVEAIGGRGKARDLADELGVASWIPAHDSTPFGLDAGRRWSYVLNKVAFWRHRHWRVDVHDSMDDIALALATDAWSRTGRVSVEAASASDLITLRSGLVLVAQHAVEDTLRLPLAAELKPAQQLDRSLCEIAGRYGAASRDRSRWKWSTQARPWPARKQGAEPALPVRREKVHLIRSSCRFPAFPFVLPDESSYSPTEEPT